MSHALYVILFASVLFCNKVFAQNITVGLHYSPPWSYENVNGEIVGIEKDIIEGAFEKQGYNVEFKIYGYSRLIKEMGQRKLDFASPIAVDIPNIVHTNNYLPFHDVAISLKDKHLKVEEVSDLKGKAVVAYQQASYVLGDEYRNVMNSNTKLYKEIHGRENQIQLLFRGRTDIVVGEERILTYLSEKLYEPNQISIHPIFKKTNYGGAAWNEALVGDFNKGLESLISSGEYQRMLDKHRSIEQ